MTNEMTHEKPAPIVNTAPDPSPAAALDGSFKKKAEKAHAKFVAKIEQVDRGIVELGEMGLDMKDKAYFTAIRRTVDENGQPYDKPDQAPTYKTSAEYFRAVLPQGSGKSQMYQAMKVVRELTSGEKPIMTREEVNGMTKENAEGLAKMSHKGVVITAEIKEAAKSMPIRQFAEEVVAKKAPELAQAAAAGEGRTLEHQPKVMMKMTLEWPSDLMAEYNAVMEMARQAAADSDRTEPLEEKAMWLVLAAARNEFQAGWEQHLFEEEQEALLKASEAHSEDVDDEDEEDVLQDEDEDEESDPEILSAIQNAPDAEEFVETRTVEPDDQ
jgi:hypothetical protein